MLISIIPAIALMAFHVTAAPADTRSETGIIEKPKIGGPHGSSFDDLKFVGAADGHRRISKLQLGPCESGKYVTYLRLEFKDFHRPSVPVTAVEHGKLGWSDSSELELKADDFITKVTLGVVKVDTRPVWKTRIGFLKFETRSGKVLGCGGYEPGKPLTEWTADAGMAFLYFSGADGNAIDNLAGHFLPIKNY